MSDRLLVIDEGTSSARAMLFDTNGQSLGLAQHFVKSQFPRPGWVEQDAEEIWAAHPRRGRSHGRPGGRRAPDRRHRHHQPA